MRQLTNLTSASRPAITILMMLGTWWFVSNFGWVNRLFLPSPGSVGEALTILLSAPQIYLDALATTYRALLGLFLSVLLAVPLGLLFGRRPVIYQFFELEVDFFRSIPSSALFFLFVLIFGVGDASKVAIVFYGCSLIVLVNTIYGAKPSREKQDRINMLRSFGANEWQIFNLAVFRDALPHITAGIRVCTSLSLVLVIVAEMFLGATTGLGKQVYDAYLAYRIPEMYATIILLGMLGFAINKLFGAIERRTTFWLPDER